MSVFRRAAAAAAALVATVMIAPAATAAEVSEPACATSSIQVSWTAHYEPGRYEMSTLVLTGLQGCVGTDLVVAVGSGQHLYAEVPVTVSTDVMTLDVSEQSIPAEQVQRLALTLRPTVPTAPTAPTSAGTGGSIDAAAPAATSLPTTGTDVAWFAALAVALVALGTALRHRSREEAERA